MFADGFEQSIVSEPAIANNRHRDTDKMMGYLYNHRGRLFQLCVKRCGYAGNIHVIQF
jgi:hypothetical protein